MSIRLLKREQVARAQAQMRAEADAAGRRQLQAAEVTNVRAAASLGAARTLTFRGRRYRVPPVPFPAGVQLDAIQLRVEQLAAREEGAAPDERLAVLAELLGLMEQAVALFRALVRPTGFWDRLTWGWRGNPFGNATKAEVANLLQGFRLRASLSGVAFDGPTPAPGRSAPRGPRGPSSLTAPTTWRRSSRGSPRG